MNGKAWTNDHTKLLIALNKAGCGDHVIAGATGHSLNAVGKRRRYLGISPVYRSQYSTWEALPESTRIAIDNQMRNSVSSLVEGISPRKSRHNGEAEV